MPRTQINQKPRIYPGLHVLLLRHPPQLYYQSWPQILIIYAYFNSQKWVLNFSSFSTNPNYCPYVHLMISIQILDFLFVLLNIFLCSISLLMLCELNVLREAIPREKFSFFLTLFKKPLTPPFRLNIYVVNFPEGILTKVRKRLSQQLSTK